MSNTSLDMPEWLSALFSEKFYSGCLIHENEKKNEKNIYCLDCCKSICPHCLSNHTSHRLLQIRRYVYNDVLRVCDAEKLVDCSYVQSYTSNKKKVVFINQRTQTRPNRPSNSCCASCNRGLQDPFLYCSLSCKLNHILRIEGRLTKDHVFNLEGVSFPDPGSDDGLMTPNSVLGSVGSNRTESGSTANGCILAINTTAETVVRKKRSSSPLYSVECRPTVASPFVDMGCGRRKNTPHRSPLY